MPTIATLAREAGLTPGCVYQCRHQRRQKGLTLDDVLAQPPIARPHIIPTLPCKTFLEDLRTLRNAVVAARYGVSYSCIRYWRVKWGIPSPHKGRIGNDEEGATG